MYKVAPKPLILRPEFVKAFGGVVEALLVQQCIYWTSDNRSKKRIDGVVWFYKTVDDWVDELGGVWDERTIRRKLNKLQKERVITTGQFSKARLNRTKWYTPNIEVINSKISPFLTTVDSRDKNVQMHVDKMSGTKRTKCPDTSGQNVRNYITENTNRDYKQRVQGGKTAEPSVGKPDAEAAQIIEYLNQKAGRQYRTNSKTALRLINARKHDGYSLADFKHVIDVKSAKWRNDPKMSEYLRPRTLFGTKFEDYVTEQLPQTDADSFANAPKKGVDLSDIPDEELPF